MEIYLYLTRQEWVEPWIKGGPIPISLASSYLSEKRAGTSTPDENLINDLGFQPEELMPLIKSEHGFKGITLKNNFVNGRRLPEAEKGNYFREDGLILSFCRKVSKDIALRMNKEACIRILDIECLKAIIDKQLEVEGVMKPCDYTRGPDRNHFLKSVEDGWQDEFRIFWQMTTPKKVTLPPGIGKQVELE